MSNISLEIYIYTHTYTHIYHLNEFTCSLTFIQGFYPVSLLEDLYDEM